MSGNTEIHGMGWCRLLQRPRNALHPGSLWVSGLWQDGTTCASRVRVFVLVSSMGPANLFNQLDTPPRSFCVPDQTCPMPLRPYTFLTAG